MKIKNFKIIANLSYIIAIYHKLIFRVCFSEPTLNLVDWTELALNAIYSHPGILLWMWFKYYFVHPLPMTSGTMLSILVTIPSPLPTEELNFSGVFVSVH